MHFMWLWQAFLTCENLVGGAGIGNNSREGNVQPSSNREQSLVPSFDKIFSRTS